MATVGSLVVKLTAHTKQFRDGLRRAGGPLRTLRRQVGMATSALMGFSGVLSGVAIVYGFKRLAQASEAFNQSMHSSLAIMDPVSNKMRRMMVETAKQVAWQTKFSAKEAADAYYYLASAGLDVERQIAAMPRVAKFAQAGMMDLARSSDVATDVVSALGLASKDAAIYLTNLKRVTNVITGAAAKANATVEQFGDALMNKGALAAKLAGKEIEEVTAIMMVMADKGFAKGAEAGQAVWMAFRDLKTKALENAAAFKALGINVDAGGGKMANIADIMEDMTRKMDKLSTLGKQRMLIDLGLPAKSLAPIMTLLGSTDKLREFQQYLENIDDVVARVANKQLPPFTKGWNKVKAAFEGIAIDNVTGSMAALGKTLEDVAEIIVDLPQRIDEMYLAWLRFSKGVYEFRHRPMAGMRSKEQLQEIEQTIGAMEHAITRVENRIVDARVGQHLKKTGVGIEGIGKKAQGAAAKIERLQIGLWYEEQAEKAQRALDQLRKQMTPPPTMWAPPGPGGESTHAMDMYDEIYGNAQARQAQQAKWAKQLKILEMAAKRTRAAADLAARSPGRQPTVPGIDEPPQPGAGFDDAAERMKTLAEQAEKAESAVEQLKKQLATFGMTGPQREAFELRGTAWAEKGQRLANQLDAKQRQVNLRNRLRGILTAGTDGAATPTFGSGAGASSREAYSAIIRASWKGAAKTQKTDEQILAELRLQTAADEEIADRIKRLLEKLEPVEAHTIRPS